MAKESRHCGRIATYAILRDKKNSHLFEIDSRVVAHYGGKTETQEVMSRPFAPVLEPQSTSAISVTHILIGTLQ
jgi:hypothetical protein